MKAKELSVRKYKSAESLGGTSGSECRTEGDLNLPSLCNSCCHVGQRKEGISISIWQ